MEIQIYESPTGACPYTDWFETLSAAVQAKIDARLAQVRAGNLGDWKSVGGGVKELRIHHGPGYRLYVSLRGQHLVLLLAAGDKSSQAADIRRAIGYLEDYEEQDLT